jgi:PKD repeat protein
VGSIGTSSPSRSRTLTHEAGHWLNLYHTWGDSNNPGQPSNCGEDDFVSDTPNTIGWSSCTLTGSSCSSPLDNVQNYMEYSYCSRMFTIGQANRMRAALTSPVADRNELITQENLIQTGVLEAPLCQADFAVDRTVICAGEELAFTDDSYHAVTSWTWNFGDGTVLSGSDPAVHRNPVHVYAQPGTYSVTLSVMSAQGSLQEVKQNFIRVIPADQLAAPFTEGFEGVWPGQVWTVENPDNGVQWEVTPAAAFSGSRSARLRNFNNTVIDERDELISGTFDMSAADTIFIGYKWSYASRLTETDDRFRISLSKDCGASWELVRLRRGTTNLPTASPTGTSFVPSSSTQWADEVLVITDPQFFTDRLRVKFGLQSKGGNNLYLDDINIWSSDAEIVGVENPGRVSGLSVYPNPSDGDLNVSFFSGKSGSIRLTLTDPAGRLCHSAVVSSAGGDHRVSVPAQSAGLYMLRLSTDDGALTRRVVFR